MHSKHPCLARLEGAKEYAHPRPASARDVRLLSQLRASAQRLPTIMFASAIYREDNRKAHWSVTMQARWRWQGQSPAGQPPEKKLNPSHDTQGAGNTPVLVIVLEILLVPPDLCPHCCSHAFCLPLGCLCSRRQTWTVILAPMWTENHHFKPQTGSTGPVWAGCGLPAPARRQFFALCFATVCH